VCYALYLYIITIETQRECFTGKLKMYYSLIELNSCVRLPIGKFVVHRAVYRNTFL